MFKKALREKLQEEGCNVKRISRITLSEGSVIATFESHDPN